MYLWGRSLNVFALTIRRFRTLIQSEQKERETAIEMARKASKERVSPRRVAVGAKGYLARRMLNFITGARSPPRLCGCPEKRREGVLLRIGWFRPSPEMEAVLESRGKGGATRAAQANELLIDWLKFR